MPQIPENILEEILSRVDIVELVSSYIPLKRAGRNFKALCPFHHEKTASFMVSPQRQIYHCFGCHLGGNAFSFLMGYEHIEFPEAVEILAKKAGVSLPKRQDYQKENANLFLYQINQLAGNFYQGLLNGAAGKAARDYLIKRNVNQQAQQLFKLGFAPANWDSLINFLRGRDVSFSSLERAGLIIAKEKGGYYDRFRNRIIFPVFDIKSRILGFGARGFLKADPQGAKYINSPQTPIYTKGRHVYGLNFAKDAIAREDCVVIVEGYLDCIVPYQEGLHNIVASLGTALTPEQVKSIKRYTNNAVIVYDGDAAGEIATLRSLDIFLEEGMQVKVVGLEEGFDPDSYVRRYGIDAFKDSVASAQGLFDYKLNILSSRYNSKDAEGKFKISLELLATIKKMHSPILRSNYIKRLAEELDIREEVLLLEFGKIKDYSYTGELNRMQKRRADINPTEKLLVKLMLEEHDAILALKEFLTPADFQDSRTAKIVSIMFNLVSEGKKILGSNLVNHLNQQEDLAQMVCELAMLPSVSSKNKERVIQDCVQRLKQRTAKARVDFLRREIRSAQNLKDETRLKDLMYEFCRLTKSPLKK